jgi:uncharacterized protein
MHDSTYLDLVQPEPVTPEPSRLVQRPVMLQGWYDLTSLHWRYDPAIVQRLLPEGFTVDTCEGSAWVGLIPFHMRRIRLPVGQRGLTAGSWSTFPETNVRTYLVDPHGRRGVWFCSLDITRLAPTLVARVVYGLPYCWSRMTIDHPTSTTRRYQAARRWPSTHRDAGGSIEVTIGEHIDCPSELQLFLSARWALGSTLLGHRLWADVDHPPWELHRATATAWDTSLIRAAGLPEPVGEPLALWSPGVEVRIGRPHRIASG